MATYIRGSVETLVTGISLASGRTIDKTAESIMKSKSKTSIIKCQKVLYLLDFLALLWYT